MRLDHFLVVGILLVKCKIQHFTNDWPSVNHRDAANRAIVILKRRADIRPLDNRRRLNIILMFSCYSGPPAGGGGGTYYLRAYTL